jgi:hypothetical protein
MENYLTFDERNSTSPIAALRLAMGRVADQEADSERYGCGSVRIVFDELTNSIMAFDGGLFHGLGAFHSGVHRLPVSVLHRTRRLIYYAFDFGLGVAGDFANAFLHLAAETPHCAGNSIISHEHPPNSSAMTINET